MFMPKFYRSKVLLRFAESHPMIHLIDEKNKRVYYKIKNNTVGGPSLQLCIIDLMNDVKLKLTEYTLSLHDALPI